MHFNNITTLLDLRVVPKSCCEERSKSTSNDKINQNINNLSNEIWLVDGLSCDSSHVNRCMIV